MTLQSRDLLTVRDLAAYGASLHSEDGVTELISEIATPDIKETRFVREIDLDEIDKKLWQELAANCRYSYQYLGDRLGLSANAAKKRVEKLVETGFIKGWYLGMKPAMLDAQFAFIEVATDGSQDDEKLVEELGSNDMVFVLLPLTTGDYVLHAEFIGAPGLLELTSFLRQVNGVRDVKVHPTTTSPGKKIELNSLHLRVLSSLAKDPRMSVSDISRNSGLTARRVRRLVDELIDSDAFDFSFIWNPNAGDSMAFIAKIEYDSRHAKSDDIDRRIREDYSLEYFYSHVSAIEPVMFSVFMVDHLFDIEKISRAIKKFPGVATVSTMIYYSATVLTPPTRSRLEEMLAE
ncbi:MAG: winged helix-turn-helix transcriptional regulator [Candidatus Hermodarchaeota archaeon]